MNLSTSNVLKLTTLLVDTSLQIKAMYLIMVILKSKLFSKLKL